MCRTIAWKWINTSLTTEQMAFPSLKEPVEKLAATLASKRCAPSCNLRHHNPTLREKKDPLLLGGKGSKEQHEGGAEHRGAEKSLQMTSLVEPTCFFRLRPGDII
ncbi:hypothetical protein Q5P01_009791 [Channa striata]|uniref:Uncharacterized protein n=1 Tax=Channa striata TaxID=64152 RepID=A0AA88SXS8_CHASR|nr:hypothetical protein Q5P01_009791 [Channa striata]